MIFYILYTQRQVCANIHPKPAHIETDVNLKPDTCKSDHLLGIHWCGHASVDISTSANLKLVEILQKMKINYFVIKYRSLKICKNNKKE